MQTISNKVTERLLSYLENGNEVDRCYAAKTLGNLRVKEATQALLERLKDEDIDVCIDAISALGKIKEPSALPLLLESLEKDPDSDVKLAVTESLAHYHNQKAIEILLKLAEERPEAMDFDENDDWDSWWDLQEKAIVILGELQVKALFPILKDILEDEYSQDIEAIVLKAMAKLNDQNADDYLINRLNDSSKQNNAVQQRRTATALGFSSTQATLKALGRALVSPSADTRENVLYALGQRKAVSYIKAILLSLRDPAANVKRAALEVLQALANESQNNQSFDYNQIAAMLNDNDSHLQAAILAFFQTQEKITPIIDSLSDAHQTLLLQCLHSDSDKVLTQAAQLAAIVHQPQSVSPLLKLALSEEHSAWVRKEAILALGFTISSLQDSNEINNALAELSQLIHNEEQTVRASAIQALLCLSNNQSFVNHFDADARSDDSLPPIASLLATLKGEQFELDVSEDEEEKETSIASDCQSCEKSAACSDVANESANKEETSEFIMQQFKDNNVVDNDHLISANEEQNIHSAMSTLEAITMDNVESAQAIIPETEAEKAHNKESGPFISEYLDDDMDEFVAIMRKNFSKGRKIMRRKINTYADARHICARLLSDNKQALYDEIIVNALAESLNDDDEVLRLEAAESLSNISLKNPLIPGLNNTFGKLVTLLDSKDSDMRIACIHAITHSGNRAALPHLLDYLSDEEYLVQLHALQGLVYIIQNKAGISTEQQEEHMILDDISNEQVIKALFSCLNNKNYSISMAAIEALTELQQTGAIEQFIDVALTDEGQSARRISKLLKKLDTEKSAELLLTRLDSVADSSYRRYVMEMLEVVVGTEETQQAA